MRKIREIRAEIAMIDAAIGKLRDQERELLAEIDMVRKARGTRIKEADWGDYREPGRGAATSKGPGYWPGE